MKKGVLGIDIGDVIIDHRFIDKNDETLWQERHSTIPATEGVFNCLKKLNDEKFHGNIFLISRQKVEYEKRTLTWLKDNDFYEKTGIKPKNVFFCRERHEKERICKEKGVTHFVDDRLEVLSHMVGKVANLYLFQPNQDEINEFKQFLPKVIRVEGWREIVDKIK